MTVRSQSPRDRILWILASSGGKMELSRLRSHAHGLTADIGQLSETIPPFPPRKTEAEEKH